MMRVHRNWHGSVAGLCAILALMVCVLAGPVFGNETTARSKGQLVYVPIYSHIYAGNREQPIYLAATLSIRNTDFKGSIAIVRADYYDTNGQLIKRFIEAPVTLTGMASTRYIIKESDKIGGSGANFVVEWRAETAVNPPLIESIMISTKSQMGVSFTSRGVVIGE